MVKTTFALCVGGNRYRFAILISTRQMICPKLVEALWQTQIDVLVIFYFSHRRILSPCIDWTLNTGELWRPVVQPPRRLFTWHGAGAAEKPHVYLFRLVLLYHSAPLGKKAKWIEFISRAWGPTQLGDGQSDSALGHKIQRCVTVELQLMTRGVSHPNVKWLRFDVNIVLFLLEWTLRNFTLVIK